MHKNRLEAFSGSDMKGKSSVLLLYTVVIATTHFNAMIAWANYVGVALM